MAWASEPSTQGASFRRNFASGLRMRGSRERNPLVAASELKRARLSGLAGAPGGSTVSRCPSTSLQAPTTDSWGVGPDRWLSSSSS